jgi:hypothetical protein
LPILLPMPATDRIAAYLSCPFTSAWELAQACSGALHGVSNLGHQGNAAMRALMLQAHADFVLE